MNDTDYLTKCLYIALPNKKYSIFYSIQRCIFEVSDNSKLSYAHYLTLPPTLMDSTCQNRPMTWRVVYNSDHKSSHPIIILEAVSNLKTWALHAFFMCKFAWWYQSKSLWISIVEKNGLQLWTWRSTPIWTFVLAFHCHDCNCIYFFALAVTAS